MESNYEKAYSEVYEILTLCPQKQLNKIPREVLKTIKQKSEKYIGKEKVKFDNLGNPILTNEAKIIILSLYRKYLVNPEIRNLIDAKLYENDKILEIQKSEKYDTDVFNQVTTSHAKKYIVQSDKDDFEENENEKNEEKRLVVYENKLIIFWRKIINKIKDILKK